MIGQRDDIAWLQSDFYRIQYHKMLRWLLYSMAINIFIILGIIYFILVHPMQDFYANTVEGKILPIASLQVT